tara:strand:- start:83 stop:1135 length:1053 start_codon:yes stop_codon:yes gene_type:complete
MAYYAKISNQEFTVSESARLREARHEKDVIENDNRASEEYATLKTAYEDSFTSATLQTLEGELAALQSQHTPEMTEEEREALNTSIAAKQAEIDTEKAALVPGQEAALASLNAKEAEGTEALTAEIETLNTAIANALCRVTEMHTGADEIEMVPGDSSAIDAEIKALEETQKNTDWGDSSDPSPEYIAIDKEIRAKLDEKNNILDVEFDNTVYWEGFYGGCKRTSYNTQGGVHKLGGTPFRKNYAGVGYIYDPVRDAFYTEQPFASWTLDESTCYWQPPTARPEEGVWYWKEDTTEWVDYVYINPDDKQPYPSWIWDTTNGGWSPPGGYPEDYDSIKHVWNEETQTWIER